MYIFLIYISALLTARCATLEQEIVLPAIEFEKNLPQDDLNDIGKPISEDEMTEALKVDFPESEAMVYNYSLYEGDIVLPDKDVLISLLHDTEEKGQQSAIRNSRQKWPSGKIPYVISSSFSQGDRSMIARAFAEYRKHTCISFTSRSSERDYVYIMRGQGCYSTVGRKGGIQYLSLGYHCMYLGTVIHEMMHAVGFWHEQSRTDRDSYVSVYWQNILPGMAYNFQKNSPSISQSLGLGYDYQSVMHYGEYAFSVGGGRQTLAARNGQKLGNKRGFSQLDIQGINKLYGCGGTPKPDVITPSGCSDYNKYCASWASAGYCRSNYKYMVINCKKSCSLCEKSSCVDVGPFCSDWSKKGECKKNPAYMKEYCKKSCSLCGKSTKERKVKPQPSSTCVDEGRYCADWSRKGECSRNPAYMRLKCKKSCKIC